MARVSGDVMERMIVDISLGNPKPITLNGDESRMWDALKSDIDGIVAGGGGVDLPPEIPSPEQV